MGTYAGAARRRIQLVTVLLRPPSGHRPGRRQARHARILQIGLRLTIAQADARPVMSISSREASVWPSPRQTPGPLESFLEYFAKIFLEFLRVLQVRSGMGANAGAARPRPPYDGSFSTSVWPSSGQTLDSISSLRSIIWHSSWQSIFQYSKVDARWTGY